MPPKPLIASERTRSIVLAVLMLALLLASLGVAYWVVEARTFRATLGAAPIRLGHLQLRVPEGWGRTDAPELSEELTGATAFADPSDPSRQLIVAAIRPTVPRLPLAVIDQVRKLVIDRGVRHQTIVRPEVFRSGWLVGMIYAEPSMGDEGIVLHSLAVLTGDGRHYDLLYLRHVVEQEQLALTMVQQDLQLLRGMCQSVQDYRLAPATPGDLQAAGLGDLKYPDQLEAFVDANGPAGQPVRLLPSASSPPQLAVMRLLAVPDSGVTDASQELSPAALLAREFAGVAERNPQGQELWTGQVGDAGAWRLVLSVGAETLPARSLWYVRTGAGRGVLIDLLSEAHAMPWMIRHLETLIRGLAAAPTTAPGEDGQGSVPASAVQAALERGQALGRWRREHLAELMAPGVRYFVIEQAGQSLGIGVEQYLAPDSSQPPLLRGRQGVWWLGDRGLVRNEEIWTARRDGSRFTVQYEARSAAGARLAQPPQRLQMEQDRLRLVTVEGTSGMQVWDRSLPPAYWLPMGVSRWPLEQLRQANSGGTLIWMSRDRQPPAPCWVTLDEGKKSEAEAGGTVRIRPWMSLDADEIEVDGQGREIRSRVQIHGRSPTGPLELTVRQAGKSEIERAFPRLKDELQGFTQEQNGHE